MILLENCLELTSIDEEISLVSYKTFISERFSTYFHADTDQKHKIKDEVYKHLDSAYKNLLVEWL